MEVSRSGARTTCAIRFPLFWWTVTVTLDGQSLSWKEPLRRRRAEPIRSIQGFWPLQELEWRFHEEEIVALSGSWHVVALTLDSSIPVLSHFCRTRDDAYFAAGRLNRELARYQRPRSPYR